MKLVRDRVPLPEGCEARVEDGDLLEVLLRLKLVEEAVEYARSGDVEELADVLEVVSEIARRRGLTLADLEAVAAGKRERRGGFGGGRVMLSRCRGTL